MFKLRELAKDDIKTINKWRNDPELIACLGAPFRFINEDVDADWYSGYMRSRSSCVRCAIVDSENESEILGLVSLVSINNVNRSGELHIMIGGADNRGKGMGTFAVRSMIEHAFYNLNLRRIELGVLETNKAAKALYEKCGFVLEGTKRQYCYKNGSYVDMLMMAVLRDEWEKR